MRLHVNVLCAVRRRCHDVISAFRVCALLVRASISLLSLLLFNARGANSFLLAEVSHRHRHRPPRPIRIHRGATGLLLSSKNNPFLKGYHPSDGDVDTDTDTTSRSTDANAAAATSRSPVDTAGHHSYAVFFEDLLTQEHREVTSELRARRANWSRERLEDAGMAVLDATAEPETELYGEKVVRITKRGDETNFRDRFSTGDVLVMSRSSWRRRNARFVPRECCVVDVFNDSMTLSVGPVWPAGLWEERRRPGSYVVRLDRTAPQAALLAQRKSLQLVRKGEAGSVSAFLADSFFMEKEASRELASAVPFRFTNGAYVGGVLESDLHEAISKALNAAEEATARFTPNPSQAEAIKWALSRRVSLIRGPPGTGKTRVAALLIATSLRLRGTRIELDGEVGPVPKVLAVAHSNGAADVLLEALLAVGVPAIRAGRPATVSPAARKRTILAMTQTHPEVVALMKQARDASLPGNLRSHAAAELRRVSDEVRHTIARSAPVVVASCIGAHQLLKDGMSLRDKFPLVVLDEASQTTEPALICALAAAKAEQVVMVGDTKQLPPTVASGMTELRTTLGMSPMARLETGGVNERTLRTQYRMHPFLLEFPSAYFYKGVVKSSEELQSSELRELPAGFPWHERKDGSYLPLAFVHIGGDLEMTHDFSGKSNPKEAELVVTIVMDLLGGGDVEPEQIAVISPYSRQVDKIRGGLGARNIRNVKVGTVDSFQGQEKEIVVLSGTRSNTVGDVGFLRDPRRLCVAVTRAKRGLIVVGDQSTLRNSKHWAALLNSCLNRGCIIDAKELKSKKQMSDEDDSSGEERSQTMEDVLLNLFSLDDDSSLSDVLR